MTLTLVEVAALLERPPGTVATWVRRKQLTPVRAGAHPLRFTVESVWVCAENRVNRGKRTRLAAEWARIVALVPFDD